ncbi:hypothetical protein [Luteipulveratus flavus]|uniref:Major facilitator superfamily (MFS) profile domain-containing protein n=1 Tax=Luteipulveratus flavus TaxID=3031728 RepID=A0ABT6C435_9MICO|nr:hypothetical protein [Luteipulveratus sp. YIM 133296]MDF8263535.1 hypothetical protein [Luteipulveratus sp. YIM 133296]
MRGVNVRWWRLALAVVGAMGLGVLSSVLDLSPWVLALLFVVVIVVMIPFVMGVDLATMREGWSGCHPLRSPLTGALMLTGGALDLVGGVLGIAVSGAWLAVCVVGLALFFGAFVLHDRGHRRRGEPPHAMWGPSDAKRPAWLGGPPTASTGTSSSG